jgi:V/A-type H+-transporting ATPase subunit E
LVKDKELEIDLTPEALAELLLEHLQPRFRALMQGIIQ